MGDDIASVLNKQFMQAFYSKYPALKQNDFYISGESYAGVYIPMFADQILTSNEEAVKTGAAVVNLKGVIIGNGCNGKDSWSCGSPKLITDFEHSGMLYLQMFNYQACCFGWRRCSFHPYAYARTCVRAYSVLGVCWCFW